MKTPLWPLLGGLLALASLRVSAVLPVQNEQIVVTCFSGTYNYYGSGSVTPNNSPTGFVVAQFNTTTGTIGPLIPPAAAQPVVWTGAASAGYHNEGNPGNEWNRLNLGEVFGVALDDLSPPNLYVAASDVYNQQGATVSLNATAPQGPGGLYKLDANNGAVVASTSLPSVAGSAPGTGPGLGNVCFRRAGSGAGYLYVSNLDDGKLYRVDSTTLAVVGAPFDHGTAGRAAEGLVPPIPDNGLAGLTPYGRRVWGVQTYQDRLYYGVWWEDSRNINSAESNEVWSVDLDVNGDFLPPTARRRVTLPNYPDPAAGLWSNPVASIGFSPGGAMYLAERYWQLKPLGSFDLTFGAHFSRLHRFTLSGPNWVTTASPTHQIGGYPGWVPPPTTIVGASSAGGVAVNCDDSIWATGDMFNGYNVTDSTTNATIPSPYLYGAMRIQAGGNASPPTPYGHGGFVVDYDGTYALSKLAIGAITTRRDCCMALAASNIRCPVTPGGPYTVDVTITNLTATPITDLQFAPCPGNQLPPGAITLTPSPSSLTLGNPIPQYGSDTVTLSLPNVPPTGATVCLLVNVVADPVEPVVLCSDKICFELPKCPCAELTASNIQCPPCLGDPYSIDLTITNIWNTPYYWYELVPCPPAQIPPGAIGVTPGPPGVQPFSPPLGPNLSQTVPVTLGGMPNTGGQACFCVRLYDTAENVLLCEEMICVELPPCAPGPGMTLQPVGEILCPPYVGGPFKFTFAVTNTQPAPAYGAIFTPCNGPGSGGGGGGFFAVTPGSVNFTPALGQGQTSQNITVCISGLQSGETGCLCVRFLDAFGRPFCLGRICFTLPPCDDPPCLHLDPTEIACPSGGNGYSLALNLTNNSGTTASWFQLCPVNPGDLPPGAVTGQPLPSGLLPVSPPVAGNGGTVPIPGIQLPVSVPEAATFCFLVKIYDEMEQLICDDMVCVTLPHCSCATSSGDVTCVDPYPNRMVVFNVTNNTNVVGTPFNFAQAVVIPSIGFSPSVMTPTPNPIPPGGTGTFTTVFNGYKAPPCVMLLIFNEDRTKCCRVKVCPLWVECDPGPPKDICDIASEVVSEASGTGSYVAWITNNSPTLTKTYNWTLMPVAIAGCTGTLPPSAFTPLSGTAGPVGPGSTQGVAFSVNGASLAPGTCAGFQICFGEVDPFNAVEPVCCPSVIRRSRPSDPCVVLNPTGRAIPSVAGPVDIVIKNPSSLPLDLDVIIFDTGGDTGYTMGGGPWPEVADDMLQHFTIAPGESTPMFAKANLAVIPGTGLPPVDPRNVELIWLRLCNNAEGYEILGTQVRFQPGGDAPHDFDATPPLRVTEVALAEAYGERAIRLSTPSRPGEEYQALAADSPALLGSVDTRLWLWPFPGKRLMVAPDGTFLGKDGAMTLDLPTTPEAKREFLRVESVAPIFGTE